MIEADRLMTDCYGITLMQMMENAGRNLAVLAKDLLGGVVGSKKICIMAGSGNNGGGGLVAARHLSNWGAEVTCILATPDQNLKPVVRHQLEIIRHLPVSVVNAGGYLRFINWPDCDLIIDAIFGYGLNREPTGVTAKIIGKINSMNCPVLALDVPSGLDIGNGEPYQKVVKADATLALALPKHGLLTVGAKRYVGRLYIGDISVPPMLYSRLGIRVDPQIFARDLIIPYS